MATSQEFCGRCLVQMDVWGFEISAIASNEVMLELPGYAICPTCGDIRLLTNRPEWKAAAAGDGGAGQAAARGAAGGESEP